MKVLPWPDRAGQADFAAQQPRDFAADRQAQSRAAVFAAGAAVRLLERLEDDLLFLRRNADAGIADRKRDDRTRVIERFVVRAPAFGDLRDAEGHLPLSVNLNALESRLRMTCSSRCESVSMCRGRFAIQIDLEIRASWLRPRGGTCDRHNPAIRGSAARRCPP